MDIDLRTISLVVVIAYFIQAFAIFFLYKSSKKYQGIKFWVFGSTLMATGVALLLLQGITPFTFIAVVLSNSCLVLGSAFIYIGILRFLDRKEDLRLIIPVFALFFALYCYFTYVNDDITIRTALMSIAMAYYLLLEAFTLFGNRARGITDSANFIAMVELFMALYLLFRAAYVLTVSPVEALFNSTAIQNVTFMLFFVKGFLLTVGLIIMVNQRLNADVTEAKEHFELFFHTSPDGVLISRLDNGVIIDINEGFRHLTGFGRDDTLGNSLFDLSLWKNPGDLKVIYSKIQERGFCENFETLFQKKDGSEITGILSARIITVQDVLCVISVTRDISNRKLVEEALMQANRKLNLLSSITRHDILNSIMVLGGYIQLALDNPKGPNIEHYLDCMNKSANTIQHQIEFTSEYQEIGVNAATWQDISSIVKTAESGFKTDKLTLNVDCRNVEIFADPLLEKVFYNLFDNAFRYAPPFTKISISCTETEDGLSVVFADDGKGIIEDDRKHLFERGFGNHTGLGLFLSREILAITGIAITENGEEGKGARFEMTVPKSAYRFIGDGDKDKEGSR